MDRARDAAKYPIMHMTVPHQHVHMHTNAITERVSDLKYKYCRGWEKHGMKSQHNSGKNKMMFKKLLSLYVLLMVT